MKIDPGAGFESLKSPEKAKLRMKIYCDADGDKIQDTFKPGIDTCDACRAAGKPVEPARIIVLLKDEPKKEDLESFEKMGGQVKSGPWKNALYGFAGTIPPDKIKEYSRMPSVLEIEDDSKPVENTLLHGAKQIGARSYVWDTYGFKGDPQTSIAIIDTGIDPTHPTFSPGYGELDWSKKVIGFRDLSSSNQTPHDSDGHGTHVAGIAAGGGFTPVDEEGGIVGTDTFKTGIKTEYPQWGQINVNKPGKIELRVLFDESSGSLDKVSLQYGNCLAEVVSDGQGGQKIEGWEEVASITNLKGSKKLGGAKEEIHWNVLTYDVPPDKLGLYHIVTTRSNISGGMFGGMKFEIYLHYPQDIDKNGLMPDGRPAFTGVAPESKLVALRSVYPSDWDDSFDFIAKNRENYHITVTSMSQGSKTDYDSVHNAIENVVNKGTAVVASAGNEGFGDKKICFPALYSDVIGVAATNAADNITYYSSQGGVNEAGKTKPDVAAPGGSILLSGGIWSADSNQGNIPGAWGSSPDRQADDAAPPQGTSQATPMVAGAAQVLVQALGGWNYFSAGSRDKALKVKQLLLMTATETVLPREGKSPEVSPTLDRGGKDVHEGFGRINLDAAVEAATLSLPEGKEISDTLYASSEGYHGKEADLSVSEKKHALARKVTLQQGEKYRFTLKTPEEGDFDLYLYSPDPDENGEPVIAQKSTKDEKGNEEIIEFIPEKTGDYYLVAKAVRGSGKFSLRSARHD